MINDKKIQAFWQWFRSVASDFEKSLNDPVLLAKLDAQIAELGDFAWEIGPGQRTDYALTISPGGDRELLSRTQEIVGIAPAIAAWEFFAAKPPKQWDPVFSFENSDGREVHIDATKWRYVLLKYPDGMLEILIEAPNLQELREEDQLLAAEIVLDGFMGEQNRLELVDEIVVVPQIDVRFENSANPIANIANHFAKNAH